MRRAVRRFAEFWVDFLIGDDWTVAALIAVAILVTWGLVHAGIEAWWLLPVVVLCATVRSVRASVLRDRS